MKTKNEYNHGEFTIATTDIFQFSYEDYVESCEDCGIEPAEEDSNAYWEWCAEQRDFNYEDDMYAIEECEAYNVPCIITGRLGLWNGRHGIAPTKCDSVYDGIQKCIGQSIDDVDVKFNNGVIEVTAHHHDGTNVFEIHALSKKGLKKVGDDYQKHDFKRLPYLYAIY